MLYQRSYCGRSSNVHSKTSNVSINTALQLRSDRSRSDNWIHLPLSQYRLWPLYICVSVLSSHRTNKLSVSPSHPSNQWEKRFPIDVGIVQFSPLDPLKISATIVSIEKNLDNSLKNFSALALLTSIICLSR